MALKRMAEFKRDDYSYESPDGDHWEITLIQTADRKYVEIKKDEDGGEQVQWDVEMLLDIADAVRSAIQKPVKRKPHQLRSPNVIDHRKNDNPSPSDTIQASVEKSMENIDPSTTVAPVQSFSPKQDLAVDLKERSNMVPGVPDPKKMIKRA